MKSLDLHSMLVEAMSKSDHVLIVGFGRGGQTVGRVLAQEDIPYFALDLDIARVQVARSAGEPVSFGDAKRRKYWKPPVWDGRKWWWLRSTICTKRNTF